MSALSFHDGFSASSTFEPVASSFFGLRAWLADDGARHSSAADVPGIPECGGEIVGGRPGALRSVFRSTYLWGPGVNTAKCLRLTFWGRQRDIEKHEPVFADCDCGFWAYTNGKHVLQMTGVPVFGVIQGWGRIVIGPHGFRAEKARIVALCFTDTIEELEKPQPVLLKVSNQLYEAAVQVARLFGIPLSMVAMPPPPPPPPAGVAPAGNAWKDLTSALERQVRGVYPHVPVFPSTGAMLRAFPLTDLTPLLPPEPPECETEEDK